MNVSIEQDETMTKEDDHLLTIFGAIIAFPNALWASFVTAKIWLWFVAPLGLPALTVWTALAMRVALNAGRNGFPRKEDGSGYGPIEGPVSSAFKSLVALAICALVKFAIS